MNSALFVVGVAALQKYCCNAAINQAGLQRFKKDHRFTGSFTVEWCGRPYGLP
jgi:hypothetical protein